MHRSLVRQPVSLLIAVLAAGLAFAAPGAARADGDAAANNGVGVARISALEGSVTLQRGDSATATAAVINAPVLGADYVTTAQGARAEIQFDAATAVRLGEGVQLRFTHIDTADRQLQLADGTIAVRLLRAAGDARMQIDTPSISVRPHAAGSYRISVDAAGATQVTVRSGRAEIVTPDGLQMVGPGTTLAASGPASNPTITSLSALAVDDFDRFNADRDQREMRALTDTYAPPGVAGIDDLDTYGRWVSDGSYGTVWAPSYVAPGWAPYRDGRWVWENAYGWTWIGSEPWGWAPYHYGRWYHSAAYGWCWVPSRAFVAWSPALVGFVTFGGVGFGFDTIGWVPLAPFEPFTPWWGFGHTTFVNVTNVFVDPPRRHHDRDVIARPFFKNWHDGGGTAVARQRFLEGRFDRKVAVTPDRMRTAQTVRGTVPIVPSVANLRFSDRPVAPVVAMRHTSVEPLHTTPSDPWTRFTTTRAAPAHRVTVIDGTTVTSAKPATAAVRAIAPVTRSAHDTPAWSRFEAASGSRAVAPREATVIREPVIRDPGAVRERTTLPAYARPVYRGDSVQRSLPVQRAEPSYRAEPVQRAQSVQHSAPVQHTQRTETHAARSTTTHH
jgi:hypothetical protein